MATINDKTAYGESATGSMPMGMGEGNQANVQQWVAVAQEKAKDFANIVTREVQENPVRTLAIAGAAGFVVASLFKRGLFSSLVKSGLGVAAAVALRQYAEQNLTGIQDDTQGRS